MRPEVPNEISQNQRENMHMMAERMVMMLLVLPEEKELSYKPETYNDIYMYTSKIEKDGPQNVVELILENLSSACSAFGLA